MKHSVNNEISVIYDRKFLFIFNVFAWFRFIFYSFLGCFSYSFYELFCFVFSYQILLGFTVSNQFSSFFSSFVWTNSTYFSYNSRFLWIFPFLLILLYFPVLIDFLFTQFASIIPICTRIKSNFSSFPTAQMDTFQANIKSKMRLNSQVIHRSIYNLSPFAH